MKQILAPRLEENIVLNLRSAHLELFNSRKVALHSAYTKIHAYRACVAKQSNIISPPRATLKVESDFSDTISVAQIHCSV